MSAPTRDLCVITFDERSNLPMVRKRVLTAFLSGIYCFQFKFQMKDKRGELRKYEDRVALPEEADEPHALEMAEFHFQRFLNTIPKVLAR